MRSWKSKKERNQDKNKGSVGEEKKDGQLESQQRSKGAEKGDQHGGRSELHVLVLAACALELRSLLRRRTGTFAGWRGPEH